MGSLISKNNSFRTNIATAMSKFMERSNYLGGMVQNGVQQLANPKWLDFEKTGIRRREGLQNNAVGGGLVHPDNQQIPTSVVNGRFNPFANVLYASLDAEKANRIYEYRLMSSFPEVQDALEIICNQFINQDSDGNVINMKYRDDDLAPEYLNDTTDEFQNHMAKFNLKEKGKGYCFDFLVDGEIYLEHIINTETEHNRKQGILGVLKLQTELMETVFKDKLNGIVGAFIGRQVSFDPTNPNQVTNIQYVPYHPNQICYISSNGWDPSGEWIVPFIERARKRYIQLSYLEDAIVIYRLVRAPERLIFNVDTGNMPPIKAEQYLKDLQQSYWKSKTFDLNTQDVQSKFQPQAMLDAFWISKGTGQEGVRIEQLPGGQNLGQLDDLNYFIRALYRALHVPTNNLDPASSESIDSSQILKEQLEFANFIISIQHHFAEALKQSFITHMKQKGKWQEYGLKENKLEVEMVPPTDYYLLRRLQAIQIRADAFSKVSSNPCFSKAWAMKHVMGLTNGQIELQYKLRIKEAAKEWEIAQIQSAGPLWKKAALQQAGAQGGAGGAGEGMPDMGGDLGGDMGGIGDMGGMDSMGTDMGGGPEDMGALGGESPEPEAASQDLEDMGNDADAAVDQLGGE